uniref:Uncharacterized protein n=1 Tax=Angiostrongylus cantonensis TaxID=6313 RepID=A0A0K0DR48_ANGCA
MAKIVVIDQDSFPEILQKYQNLFKTANFECKERPYIASPFMPIATPLSIPLERRAPNSPKPSKKNAILNGSAKPDGLLAADELRIPTTNDEWVYFSD